LRWIARAVLSRARLARDEHRRLRRRAASDPFLHLLQGRRIADDPEPFLDREPEVAVLLSKLPLLDRIAQGQQDALALERLLDEVERTQPGRLDGRRDRTVPRNHDHGKLGPAPPHLGKHFQAVHPRKLDVQQDRVRVAGLDPLQGLGSRSSLVEAHSLILEDPLQRGADVLLIVNDQDVGLLRGAHMRPRLSGGYLTT